MLKMLVVIDEAVEKVIKVLLVILFLLMTVVALTQVYYRFVLEHSLTWTDEFCRYALIWVTLLSIGVAVKRRSHISIDLIRELLSPKMLKIFEKFWNLCAIVFCVVLVKYGLELAQLNMVQYSAGMHIQLGYMYYSLPIGGVIIVYYSLLQLFGLDKKIEAQKKKGGA